jgi:hypothetical protein
MTEKLWEKHRIDMEVDLGVVIEPYTEEELETLNVFSYNTAPIASTIVREYLFPWTLKWER